MGKIHTEREKIGVHVLKEVTVLYKGDIYDLACLLLKINDAKDKGTNVCSYHTVYGLSGDYAMLARIDRDQVVEILEKHNLPLGARVEYDYDI